MVSRIGKLPVELSQGVTIETYRDSIDNKLFLKVSGKLGHVTQSIPDGISLRFENRLVFVEYQRPAHASRSMTDDAAMGTARALLAKMHQGVVSGFEKKLELIGVGYKAQLVEKTLHFSLGYSHPVHYTLPDELSAELPTPTEIILKSCNFVLLGEVAARIRRLRKPERYKGKGIRYAGEVILLKEGKKK